MIDPDNLVIQPVLLHGDLWVRGIIEGKKYSTYSTSQSGNAGVDQRTQKPVIFDPASYYGHNEAECVPIDCDDKSGR